jgi:hypothetical protein
MHVGRRPESRWQGALREHLPEKRPRALKFAEEKVTQNAVSATESVEGEAVRPATIEPVGRRGQVDSTSAEDTESDEREAYTTSYQDGRRKRLPSSGKSDAAI